MIRAGAAKIDITPKAGTHLAGNGHEHRPVRMVLDPLWARALVLESGGRKICIVTLDVTIVSAEHTARIRLHAAERHGFDPDAVMVHALQSHSAPGLGQFMLDRDFEGVEPQDAWLRGCDDAYDEMAVVRACEAVDAACATLRPVRVGLGRAIEGRLAFNRRAVRKDGTVAMPGPRWDPPLGPTWIQYIEGPIDPEVGVLCLQDDDLRVPAVLAHYTCHPVHVFPKPIASSDWPGALAEGLASALGPECVGVVVNGACGNINPWDPFDPHYLNDHRRMGAMLAVAACSVVQGMQFRDVSAVGWTARRIELPVREVEPGRLAAARATLDCHPTPRWTNDTHSRVDPQWLEAASIWSAHLYRARQRTMQYEVQVFRIGDAAIVGLPGEPFVEGQLAIKMRSPAAQTFVAHCTTQYVGYIPTREAFARGGHEVNTTYWSKLMPDALDTVVETAAEMLGQLFAERAD